jgi:autotransporter strand-loop-strand O-heptosyltransferase
MILHESSISIYDDIERSEHHLFRNRISIRIHFDYSPKVTIDFGDFTDEPYRVEILELDGTPIHVSQISTGMFTYAFRRWIKDHDILVFDNKNNLVKKFNLFHKIKTGKVLVAIESDSLGDTLAWTPYINVFFEHHQCLDLTVTTFWNELFKNQYPGIKFKHPGFREENIDVLIGIGWYDETNVNVHKNDPRTISLQQVAADLLGVNYQGDVRPRIHKNFKPKDTSKKTVCIGTESTAAAKHWNRPNAWQELVDLLNESGYEVKVIQKQSTYLQRVVDNTGNIDIKERIAELLNCEFYIGIGSGLSWLAWGLDVPVVLISGFSKPFCEFNDRALRIINENVCNGCFNNTHYKFDKGDWWWCPAHKDTDRHFECTKEITPEDVFSKITSWKQEILN